MVEAKIKELSEEFLNDTTWDSINIEKAVISHSFTVSKWINKWMGFKRILDKVQKEFDEKWQEKLGKQKYNDLKESLTVLLNSECKDLFGKKSYDGGYPQHKALREKITQLWIKEKDMEKLWDNLVI